VVETRKTRGPISSEPEEFLRALETVSGGIRDPVAKLRFIRTSLSRYETVDRVVRTVPWSPARHLLYRWLSLEGLRHLLDTKSLGRPARVDVATRVSLVFGRAAVVGLGLILGTAAGVGAYRHWRPPAAPLMAAPRHVPAALPSTAPLAGLEGQPLDAPEMATAPMAAAVSPAGVWLVEKGAQWELYSNGLRIDTTWAVKGTPRAYRVFTEDGALEPGVRATPVGLLFHTSESDVWPLEASFNEHLRDSSHALLRYVHDDKLYNYVIDRFGRVYRVVGEGSKANHAGFSVWADAGRVYLNLNHAFLGVSFETRWEGGRALPITQAQLAAGRSLSDYLRQRYDIVPGMCVTHGLASVNPRTHLIGHHLDWARGFPFAAFGLPDQYRREAPSVALFGFDYDDDFLKVLEPWPGVRVAEASLARAAARTRQPIEDLRHQRQEAYDRWLEAQSGEESPAPARAGGGGTVSTSRPEGLQ